MRVLIACEFSGVVRETFRAKGHDAWSCDLLPSEDGSLHHLQRDIIEVLRDSSLPVWDMMIAFPPCTHLCVSGARWFSAKPQEQQEAVNFFMALETRVEIPKVAIENPIGIMSTRYRKPDQIIQPWQFGHGETKGTCLWLKNLPLLVPTNIVEGREARIHKMPPSDDRGKLRSITYTGIANAMADQWL
jgi:hypothetical protein